LDLVVFNEDRVLSRPEQAEELSSIGNLLEREDFGRVQFRVLARVFGARVPVLKASATVLGEVRKHHIRLDIVFGQRGFSLPGGTKVVIDDLIREFLDSEATGKLRALTLLAKIWKKRRRLNKNKEGGLTSFALVLLCLEFFGTCPERFEKEHLETLLRSFFQFMRAWNLRLAVPPDVLLSFHHQHMPLTAPVHSVGTPAQRQDAAVSLSPEFWEAVFVPELDRAVTLLESGQFAETFEEARSSPAA